MNRKLVLGAVLFFAVVGISLVADQPQAMGGWWHRAANCGGCWGGYYTGCYGGWSGCYGYTGCGGCYGYTGCGGCYGYTGWSGCGGCWGGCGGWSVCGTCAPCGGVVVGSVSGCCGDVVTGGKATPDSTPLDGEVKQPTPATPKPEAAPANGASASLNLSVPSDAKVVINDHVTKSTGESRRYVSRGLESNMEYQFTIRAEVTRNGEKVERTKVVNVRANDSVDVTFDFQAPQVASVAR